MASGLFKGSVCTNAITSKYTDLEALLSAAKLSWCEYNGHEAA
jgi:hypothetical protein